MSAPVVFLDIDGVVNHSGCYRAFHKAMEKLSLEEAKRRYSEDAHVELLFAPECVAALNEITDRARAEIVLSSSWRMLYWDERERFRALARRVGIRAPVVDFTPRRGDGIYGSGLQRGDEIAAWLRASRRGRTQIVVLDDDDDMLAVAPWFVQTDAAVGLTPRNAARALTILRGRPWVDGGARRP